MTDWHVFRGNCDPHDWPLPPVPPWRDFGGTPLPAHDSADWWRSRPADLERANAYRASDEEIELVNVAIFLRRPLLITGKPGTGKSTLAYAIAYELGLGPVLRWPITSRSTLQDGLYRYDAIGRLQDANLVAHDGRDPQEIGRYIELGPLGTALLPYERPQALLIDEIDKSDIDLPNDLLNIFEEGEFRIPELARRGEHDEVAVRIHGADHEVRVRGGTVRCSAFPIVVLTSNGERDFPPAFLRRCIRLDLAEPDADRLAEIVEAHLGPALLHSAGGLIEQFVARREAGELATDQLLNAIFLSAQVPAADRPKAADAVLRYLSSMG